MARLFAQGQPVINGAAADGESLVRLHFAQAAIKGRQNSQTQIHTIRFAHFNSVAQKTLRAIVKLTLFFSLIHPLSALVKRENCW